MGGSYEIEEKKIPDKVFKEEFIDDKKNVEINEINPYSILNISPNASISECRLAYKNLATVPDRKKEQKVV